jgi:hypothetical protein
MMKAMTLFAGAASFALLACAHGGPDASSAPRPASDTMESQTNDMGTPFPSSPKFHEALPSEQPAPTDVDGASGTEPLNAPPVRPYAHPQMPPEDDANARPKRPVPIAPYTP